MRTAVLGLSFALYTAVLAAAMGAAQAVACMPPPGPDDGRQAELPEPGSVSEDRVGT